MNSPYERRRVPLVSLLVGHDAMAEVFASGRVSETPDEPVLLYVRPDMPGRFEMGDGHHRVAAAVREGRTHVVADIDGVPHPEPLAEPFWVF